MTRARAKPVRAWAVRFLNGSVVYCFDAQTRHDVKRLLPLYHGGKLPPHKIIRVIIKEVK